MNKMRERWRTYWSSLGLYGNGQDVYETVREQMNMPYRHYHNFLHIAEMLDFMQNVQDQIKDPTTFAWKVWFHDLIYRAGAADNEERSAAMAAEIALCHGLSTSFVHDIVTGIIATKNHYGQSQDDLMLITADLAILAAPKCRFAQYCRGIEKEYAPVYGLSEFRRRRLEWVEKICQRGYIYPTAYGQQHLECKTRTNLGKFAHWLKCEQPA